MTTHSLQCYITTFPSTPTLWNYIFRSKYIFGYGKSPYNQHFITGLQHMATLGEAPEWESATTLGQHTLSSSRTTLQPHGQGHSTHYTFFTWRVNRRYRSNLDSVSHKGVYVMAIGLLIPVGLWIFCCYFFWCWPARLAHWPLQPGTMQYHARYHVDDDVEGASIYRYDGKASQPIRPCENHGLHIEHIPTWTERQCK